MIARCLNRSRKDFEILVDQKGGKINLDDFILFMEYHQSMLFPIFDIQLHLRRKILGFKFWDSCAKRRVEISHGKSLTIREIIELEAINHSTDFIVKAQGVETKEGKIAMDNLGNQHHRRGSKDNSIHQEQQHPPMHHNGKFKISKESSYSNILFVLAPSFQEVDDLLNQRHPSMAPELADALNKQRHQQQQEEKTESQDHNKDHPPTRKTSLHPTAKHDSFALMDNEVRKLELEGKNHSIHEPQRHHSTEYRDVPFREKDIDDHKHDRRRSKEQLLDQIMDEEREKNNQQENLKIMILLFMLIHKIILQHEEKVKKIMQSIIFLHIQRIHHKEIRLRMIAVLFHRDILLKIKPRQLMMFQLLIRMLYHYLKNQLIGIIINQVQSRILYIVCMN